MENIMESGGINQTGNSTATHLSDKKKKLETWIAELDMIKGRWQEAQKVEDQVERVKLKEKILDDIEVLKKEILSYYEQETKTGNGGNSSDQREGEQHDTTN